MKRFAVTSALLLLLGAINLTSAQSDSTHPKSIEPLPIFSYDNDAGFGYGVKSFFLNQFDADESFDIVLFNSTKGERWYRLVSSLPDFELRQGKKYDAALDFTIDYDKWISNAFYGIGSQSKAENKAYYTKESFEVNLAFSRGFEPDVVGTFGIRYRSVKNFNIPELPEALNPQLINSTTKTHSMFFTLRYDTRNSFINPSGGLIIEAEAELAPKTSLVNTSYSSLSGQLLYFTPVVFRELVLASRLMFKSLYGDNLPQQILLSLGGNRTLRGFSQDRFIDRVSTLFNSELRFPIYWRFGGILGLDCGKVSSSVKSFSLKDWAFSPAAGLRFYFDTFIVRLDMGFSRETTALYFNFNHIF